MSQLGQTRKYSLGVDVFRCSPNNGHRQDTSACPVGAKSGSAGAHSITSSARPSKDSGMVMPSALAVEVNEQFDLCGLLHG
jgi:hypothetical protein